MNLSDQILFFFAAVGAFNGVFLSAYFAFFVTHRNKANYFLAALLVAISLKVISFVVLHFDNGLSETIVIVGFIANALVGPLFYLYVKQSVSENTSKPSYGSAQLVLAAIAVPLVSFFSPLAFSYIEGTTIVSQYTSAIIHFQWLVYLVLSAFVLKGSFKKVFQEKFRSKDEITWLVSLFMALAFLWLAPLVTIRTTYMVGALSFSTIFYVLVFLWVSKFRKSTVFFDHPVKYASKKIDALEAATIAKQLYQLFDEQEPFKDPDLKIAHVAKALQILPQRLSQFLNDNLGKSFSLFINEYRIEAAKEAIIQNDKYTLEVIGYECGFNSKSTFFTTFKSLTGLTPAGFKNQHQNSAIKEVRK